MKWNKKTILFSKEGYIGRLVSYQLLFICWSRMGSNLSCKQEYTRQNTNFLSQTTFNQFAAESLEISSKYVQKFFSDTRKNRTDLIVFSMQSMMRSVCCVVECRICNREVAGSNLSMGYFTPRSTQPSIPPGSVNEYQLRLRRQAWLIPIADERVGVQVKL